MKFTITYLPPPYSLRFSVFHTKASAKRDWWRSARNLGKEKAESKACLPLRAERRLGTKQLRYRALPFSQNFRNFRLAVNGTRFIGSSHWKIPRKKWKIWKGGLLFPVGISERNFAFHSDVSRSLYQFQVHGKKICHGQLANQNGFPRAHVSMRFVFLLAPQWKHFCTTSALTLD